MLILLTKSDIMKNEIILNNDTIMRVRSGNMKKKISFILAAVVMLSFLGVNAGAVNVIMNSSFVNFPDQEPVIVNDTTLVPIRPIAEKLGLEILWDDPTDTVTLKKDNFYIEMVIGSTKVKTSAGEKDILTAPVIISSRTMVPLRFIAEELGLKVTWNGELQRVIIVGEVDTAKMSLPKKEDVKAETGENVSEEKKENTPANTQEVSEPTEEETADNTIFASVASSDSTLTIEIPADFLPEDTDDENGYAFRTLDAVDVQHLYDWEKVSECASYATSDANSGIVYVVRQTEPYEEKDCDLSKLNASVELPDPPERPQFPDIDLKQMAEDMEKAIVAQMFTDLNIEMPENVYELEDEEIMALLGFDNEEAFSEQMQMSMENTDFSVVAGYAEYLAYQEEYKAYSEEMKEYNDSMMKALMEISEVRSYAGRNFAKIYSQVSDEEWLKFFNSTLNSDPEVRYEGLEILKINDKPVIHATIYAEDPDDEQGVFEYYEYRDHSSIVTIFGGTLFGSEPGEDVVAALGNISIG